jgi:hypothetical protein
VLFRLKLETELISETSSLLKKLDDGQSLKKKKIVSVNFIVALISFGFLVARRRD